MESMTDVPHKTVISVLRDALTELRMRHRWSRETLADELVAAYHRSGWDTLIGFEFQDTSPGGRDVIRALETNADRLWRWLDDQTKSSTLLPLNFLPVVLSILPPDLRLSVLCEVLRPVGVEVSLPRTREVQISHAELMATAAKESGEGLAAFAHLAERADLKTLQKAEIELVEAVTANATALNYVRARLSGSAT